MRRLVALTSTIIAVDAMLFTALSPLIPGYAAEFGSSKGGAGLLVGAFGAGALIGGVASGYAATRFGPKPLVVVGLVLLSVASLAFAFAGGPWSLGASRFVQGLRARRRGPARSPGSPCGPRAPAAARSSASSSGSPSRAPWSGPCSGRSRTRSVSASRSSPSASSRRDGGDRGGEPGRPAGAAGAGCAAAGVA